MAKQIVKCPYPDCDGEGELPTTFFLTADRTIEKSDYISVRCSDCGREALVARGPGDEYFLRRAVARMTCPWPGCPHVIEMPLDQIREFQVISCVACCRRSEVGKAGRGGTGVTPVGRAAGAKNWDWVLRRL